MSEPQIFEQAYYQRLNDIEISHPWAIGMRKAMMGLLRSSFAGRENLRVLDVGCGTGFLMQYLNRLPEVSSVVGLDYSYKALEYCRGKGIVELLQGDAVHLPFQPNTFDLIICIDTIQHLSPEGADRAAVAHFRELLRPNGLLYLRTNSALGHIPLKGVDKDLYRRYLRKQLVSMVESSGLVVERSSYLNFTPSVWGAIKEYVRGGVNEQPRIGPGLAIEMPRSRWVSTIFKSMLHFEAVLIEKFNLDLPFGHSLALVGSKIPSSK